MNDYIATEVEGIDLEPRTERALTEYMTVLPLGGDIYSVTTESGSEYRVDAREGRCTCPDHKHRDVRCKHQRRVAFATGRESLDAEYILTIDVDPQVGEHVSGLCVVTSDGGVIEHDGSSCDSGGGEPSSTGSKGNSGEETTNDGGRPDDCDCGGWNAGLDLPCWPCYRDGFEVPAGINDELH